MHAYWDDSEQHHQQGRRLIEQKEADSGAMRSASHNTDIKTNPIRFSYDTEHVPATRRSLTELTNNSDDSVDSLVNPAGTCRQEPAI